ncbi:MAG: hypothetical protein WCF67_02060 [Chitinophagaceae bacterium]
MFKELQKKYTNAEIAEAYVFPNVLTKKEHEKEIKLFAEFRQKRLAEMTPEEKLLGKMMQLKLQMQDYIQSKTYRDDKRFGYFLTKYIEMLERKNKDFASDINIKPVELSQLLNHHRNPNIKIFIRLEIHSGNNIPAYMWYKLVEKEKEHVILTDKEIRKQEKRFVRNPLKLAS